MVELIIVIVLRIVATNTTAATAGAAFKMYIVLKGHFDSGKSWTYKWDAAC